MLNGPNHIWQTIDSVFINVGTRLAPLVKI